jgi:hypothetical protein
VERLASKLDFAHPFPVTKSRNTARASVQGWNRIPFERKESCPSWPKRTVARPPMSGHLASSQHRRKADMPSQPASLRDVRTGNGSRRSRGPTGRIRRAPRRRHLSPTVLAANRPRAAGPRAGGAKKRKARVQPEPLKKPRSSRPQRVSAVRGKMRQRSSPEGPRPLRGSVERSLRPALSEASAEPGLQRRAE